MYNVLYFMFCSICSLLVNFFVCYTYHILTTLLFLLFTLYTTGSTKVNNEKLQNLLHKFKIKRQVMCFYGNVSSPCNFDMLIPYLNPIVIIQSADCLNFSAYREFVHIKKKHTLKYFILIMILCSVISINCNKFVWYENILFDIISYQFLGRYFENLADKYALAYCSNLELTHLLESTIKLKKHKKNMFDKILEFVQVTPTCNQRMRNIKNEIELRIHITRNMV